MPAFPPREEDVIGVRRACVHKPACTCNRSKYRYRSPRGIRRLFYSVRFGISGRVFAVSRPRPLGCSEKDVLVGEQEKHRAAECTEEAPIEFQGVR
ncbi:hypothetical protein MHYP_G00202380 [Metynnis hypsauchen]